MVKVVEWTYDPSPAEWGLMIFAMINFGINAISWVYLIYWRDYPPIRAKQIDILLMSAVAGWLWFLGALSSTRVIPQRGAMLACSFWAFWVQLMFGAVLWISCLILRMYRLYTILIEGRVKANLMKNPKRWLYSRLAIIVFPVFVATLLFTGLDADRAVSTLTSTGEYKDLCIFQPWALYFSFIVALCYFGVAIYFIYALRSIKRFLNEYKESKLAITCLIIGFFIYALAHLQGFQYQVWGRVLCCAVILLMVNISYWSLVGSVIYGRFFHPVETLDRFIASKDYNTDSTHTNLKKSSKCLLLLLLLLLSFFFFLFF